MTHSPSAPRALHFFPTRRSSDLGFAAEGARVVIADVDDAQARKVEHEAPSGTIVARHTDVTEDRKSTRLNSSHGSTSYAVFCLKKKKSRRTGCRTTPGQLTDCDP